MGQVSARALRKSERGVTRRHRAWRKVGHARLRLEMVRLATRLIGRDDAQDLVQEAFRRAVRLGKELPRDGEELPSSRYMSALVRTLVRERREALNAADATPRRGR